jgi:hypothetical protein
MGTLPLRGLSGSLELVRVGEAVVEEIIIERRGDTRSIA